MDRGIPGSTSHRGRLTVDVREGGPPAANAEGRSGPAVQSVVITPRGELDHHTADLLREPLERCVEDGRRRLVVDCSGLEFCDSTGLNVLLGARLKAEAVGGRVYLAAMTPVVARLFEITGAGAVFAVHDTVAEALEAREEPSGA